MVAVHSTDEERANDGTHGDERQNHGASDCPPLALGRGGWQDAGGYGNGSVPAEQREGAHKSNMHAQGEGREGSTRILRRLRPSSYRAANTGGAAALGGEGGGDEWARG
jgi:hypothetical protein